MPDLVYRAERGCRGELGMYANSNKFIDPPGWRVKDKEGAQMALPPLAAGLHVVVSTPQQREGSRVLPVGPTHD